VTESTLAGFVPWPPEFAERYRRAGVWRGQTLFDALFECAERHGERIAAVDKKRSVTYRELRARSEQLARGLLAWGIRPGDALLVQLPNSVTFLELCFALFRLGARPVMTQPAHRRLELCQLASQSGAVAHVTCDTFANFDHRLLAQELRALCPEVRHTFVLGDPGPEASALAALYEPLATTLPSGPAASDVALFQLSGGSTDVPKLIPRTHDDYLYSVRQSVAVCDFSPETVYLTVLPVAHNFPLSSPGVLGTLLAGGKVVFSEHATPDVAFDWIAREQVTHTALVPALVPAWLLAAARQRKSLVSLRHVQVGGAKLQEALARRIEPELGARLQQVFGMAEGLVCYTRTSDTDDEVYGTQGSPMSELDELRVVDDDDCDVPRGSEGHLLVRGPYTIRGYFNSPAHDRSAFTEDGFYRTGDRVRWLASDKLVVVGRAKDQINRGGEKIAAPEVEAQLLTHPAVEAAALIAVPDPFLGERSHAYVVAQDSVTPRALIEHLKASGLASYKLPDRIELCASLPKTPVGKIDKRALRLLLANKTTAETRGSAREPNNEESSV
jgi:2,3-dihydroxybenzoate-AMP ligase